MRGFFVDLGRRRGRRGATVFYMKRDIFKFAKTEIPETVETVLRGRGGFRVERIRSEAYTNGEWYDQSEDEFVMLLSGAATLEFADGRRVELSAGEWLVIRRHVRHRVAAVSAGSVWLALFGDFD